MATTTNYGWETPDDTDLVKDGALAMRTLGNAIDSTLGSFLNIKQIVTGTTSTALNTTVATDTNTGLTATITPSSASNKIIVLVSHGNMYKNSANSQTYSTTKLWRNSTVLQSHNDALFTNSAMELTINGDSFLAFDNPATTSAVTYKTTIALPSAVGSIRIQASGSTSTIILIEVEA